MKKRCLKFLLFAKNIPISCKYPGENTFEIQLAHNSEIIFITKKVNAREMLMLNHMSPSSILIHFQARTL